MLPTIQSAKTTKSFSLFVHLFYRWIGNRMADEETNLSKVSSTSTPPLQQNEDVGGSTEARSMSKGSQKNETGPGVKTFYGRNPGSKTAETYFGSKKNIDGISIQRDKVGTISSLTQNVGVHRDNTSTSTSPLQPNKYVGGSTEARSKSEGSHKNKKSSHPRVKMFYGRNPGAKSSGSCSRSDVVGGGTCLSSDSRNIGERRNQCDDATHFTHSSSPENSDGNPLTPDLGGSSETRSKSIGSHKNKKSIHPGVKAFYGQNPDSKTSGSCSQSGNSVGEICSLCDKVGGNSSLTHNVGVHSVFSGPPQNMHDQTLSTNDHIDPDSGGNMDAGFATVDYNAGFAGVQFPAFPNLVQTVEGGLFPGHEGLQFADLKQTPSPSRGECFLCHRDLSLPPEDQIVWSALRPVTGVLPCHHHFHAQCLEIITPTDQSECPPCIQCQVDM